MDRVQLKRSLLFCNNIQYSKSDAILDLIFARIDDIISNIILDYCYVLRKNDRYKLRSGCLVLFRLFYLKKHFFF